MDQNFFEKIILEIFCSIFWCFLTKKEKRLGISLFHEHLKKPYDKTSQQSIGL